MPPPPRFRLKNPEDSIAPVPVEQDSVTKPESSLEKGDGSVYLVGVEGQTTPGYLPVNDTLTIYLGISNNTGNYVRGMSNAFRLYSPDGAQWDTTIGSIQTDIESEFDLINQVMEVNLDGISADTVGFALQQLSPS